MTGQTDGWIGRMDRQTHDASIYCASIVSCGNKMLQWYNNKQTPYS